MNKYLHREDVPFDKQIWELIDACVVETAQNQLSGRRLLAIEGPFGLGLKSISNRDKETKDKTADDVSVMFSSALPLAMIQKNFYVGTRDIAAFEADKTPIDLANAAQAAIACANQENSFLYSGAKGQFPGLLDARGVHEHKIKGWNEIGKAVEDVIHAVNILDNSGFHGPYALGLEPCLYNSLFHRYPQGNTTEIEHMKELISKGIFKAVGLPAGGILAAHGKQFASILLGQDLTAGFVGPDVGGYEFSLTESFTLRLLAPEAFCVLKLGNKN